MPMTDQERVDFLAIAEKYDSAPGVDLLTQEDARLMCMGIGKLGVRHSRMLMTHIIMKPEYVDLMFEAPSTFDVMDILTLCINVKPRHIEMAATFLLGKNAQTPGELLEIEDVWGVLLSHPLCTDAVRVKYQLLRGE